MNVTVVEIGEHIVPGRRLGRHVEHDPRSRDYPYEAAATVTLRSVLHRRYGGVFDQGNLGSCTGNACAGAINTAPVHSANEKLLTEADAVQLYEQATVIDGIPGSYPPDDTGSSGLAVAKAARQRGLIGSYRHAFTVETAVAALMNQAVITGVAWYEGFDRPDAHGLVKIAGQVRGGHEFEIRGFQYDAKSFDGSLVVAENSWGTVYGLNGLFTFTVATWRQLLAQQGDTTILLPPVA